MNPRNDGEVEMCVLKGDALPLFSKGSTTSLCKGQRVCCSVWQQGEAESLARVRTLSPAVVLSPHWLEIPLLLAGWNNKGWPLMAVF